MVEVEVEGGRRVSLGDGKGGGDCQGGEEFDENSE